VTFRLNSLHVQTRFRPEAAPEAGPVLNLRTTHPDFKKINIGKPEPLAFGARLLT